MSQDLKMTEAEQQQWTRDQYQVATKYLAEKGIVTDSVQVEESRYLVPLLALWQLTSLEGKKFWVLSGDLPTDHSNFEVAANARDALRHFSLKWQMQSENLLRSDIKEQKDFAHLLISRAEGIYKLCEDDSLWKTT
jgi:hypothetical protein